MKKKIIIAISVFSLFFLVSGLYIIITIEKSTITLDNLIKLHRVEILREHLLIQLKRAQSDLYLKNTRYARSMDTVVNHVRTMNGMVNDCFGCHHSENVTKRLDGLKDQIEQYKNALSRVFTIRANRHRLEAEEDMAFKIGTSIISEVNDITTVSSMKLEERTHAVFRDIAGTKTILYVLFAAVPLVALVSSVVFLRGFTRPVEALLTATRRLKSGELDYRIKGLRDEYGEVAASFNEMASSLKEHYLRMQWAEQIVVLGELAGGLAHEMKNPLAGIKTSMEVLAADHSLSEENRDVLMKVIEQIRRIELLLKSLLNFARPPKPQFMLVDVNDVLDATISLVQRHPLFTSNDSKPITIMKDFDSRLPATIADPLQLQQVFMNLLLNAADAMPNGGTITARTSHTAPSQFVHITISDTGKGIDRRVIEKIFLPFFTTKPKGTGLGLAITKRLVEQHGGNIRVEINRGGGASFTVALPLKRGDEVHMA